MSLILLFILFGPAVIAYANSISLSKIFDRLYSKRTGSGGSRGNALMKELNKKPGTV